MFDIFLNKSQNIRLIRLGGAAYFKNRFLKTWGNLTFGFNLGRAGPGAASLK